MPLGCPSDAPPRCQHDLYKQQVEYLCVSRILSSKKVAHCGPGMRAGWVAELAEQVVDLTQRHRRELLAGNVTEGAVRRPSYCLYAYASRNSRTCRQAGFRAHQ